MVDIWRIHIQGREVATFGIRPGDSLVLGRGTDADIRLDNPAVSRRHARLHRLADGYALEDLGSRNGTFVNDRPVACWMEVGPGDRIRVGKFLLERVPGAPPSPEVDQEPTVLLRPFRPAEIPRSRLTVEAGPAEPGQLVLDPRRVARIGRAPYCDLRVRGWGVAGVHCLVERRDGAWVLVPQVRWRRVRVNGRLVRDAVSLRSGDAIRVAGATLRFA